MSVTIVHSQPQTKFIKSKHASKKAKQKPNTSWFLSFSQQPNREKKNLETKDSHCLLLILGRTVLLMWSLYLRKFLGFFF